MNKGKKKLLEVPETTVGKENFKRLLSVLYQVI